MAKRKRQDEQWEVDKAGKAGREGIRTGSGGEIRVGRADSDAIASE